MTTGPDEQSAAILAAAEKIRAAGLSESRFARDPVSMAAIRNWTDAIGDANPLYTDAEFAARSPHGQLVAPPAMAQVWTMPGLRQPLTGTADTDPLGQMMAVLDEAGFRSVVATNCAQTYYRYLRHGELLSLRSELTDVAGPKRTALGDGWFVTTRNVWYSGDEPVAEMDWRVFRFCPRPAGTPGEGRQAAAPTSTASATTGTDAIMRPSLSPDTAFFWAGTQAASCASSAAASAALCAIRPGRPASRAVPSPSRATWWRPAPARSTATSCTGTRPCQASSSR